MFSAIWVVAASAAASSSMAVAVAACCAIPIGAVVILELAPSLAGLLSSGANAAQRRAIRCLRHELDALPEAPHPLDL